MTFKEFNKWRYVHGVYAGVLMLPALLFPMIITCLFASHIIVAYYNREWRDAQSKADIDAHAQPFALMPPWQWHRASQDDFWSVLVVCAGMLVVKFLV